MDIARHIESTNLSPTITGREVDELVSEAKQNNFLGVCVPPFWVKRAAREIGNTELQLITVIGYPLGFQMTESKIAEIGKALDDGADELDVVINFSAFSDGMPWGKIELVKCAKIIHEAGAFMKAIVETDIWDEAMLRHIIKVVSDSGVDFLKTSTGYHRTPVTINTIQFIRELLPSNVGIKASGGISKPEQAGLLIRAGADRLGTSNAIRIMS